MTSHDAGVIRALAVTVSNRAAAGVYDDRSGPVLAPVLRHAVDQAHGGDHPRPSAANQARGGDPHGGAPH